MNTKLATTLVIGALLAPVAGYAAEKSATQTVKEAVSDSVITTKIKAEYAKDKTVSMLNISVDTDDKGVVTLGGNAKSRTESDHAAKIARDTKGVTSVRNNIMVADAAVKTSTGSSTQSATSSVKEAVGDAVITTKIKAAYAKDKVVDMLDISVDTDNKGVVTLTGAARNKAEVDQAGKIARETKGVTSVKNNIVISSESAKSSMSSTAKTATSSVKEAVSDSVITAKIKTEYAKDKTVSMLNISVETDDKGVVTLGGAAKSKAEVDQAVKIARDTKGVTSVKSNIKVSAK